MKKETLDLVLSRDKPRMPVSASFLVLLSESSSHCKMWQTQVTRTKLETSCRCLVSD